MLFPQQKHHYLFNDYRTLEIACGQCHGCRLKRSREWAIRCMHEKQMHKHSCYITLTYKGQQHNGASLDHRDFQLFMKRLRKALGREVRNFHASASRSAPGDLADMGLRPMPPGLQHSKTLLTDFAQYAIVSNNEIQQTSGLPELQRRAPAMPSLQQTGPNQIQREGKIPQAREEQRGEPRADYSSNKQRNLKGYVATAPRGAQTPKKGRTNHPALRFYMCGEYGEMHGRPHFHALLFGLDFADKKLHRASLEGHHLYTSQTLDKLWGKGFTTVGELTFESAAYVARYVMKKRTGDGQTTHYEILDPQTGEIIKRKKEYNCMSRRPGVGSTWLAKYHADVYANKGKVIMRGHEHNPPRYYDKKFKNLDQLQLEHLKHVRYIEQLAHTEHHTPERLAVQEQVSLARTKQLKRHLTNGD